MSDWWFDATYPKARKEHVCHMCARTIGPGEAYRRQGYVSDGRKSATKVCAQCEAFATILHKLGFEGEEGGWAYLPELEQGEVAYCGYSAEMQAFRAQWRNDDGSLYDWASHHPEGSEHV